MQRWTLENSNKFKVNSLYVTLCGKLLSPTLLIYHLCVRQKRIESYLVEFHSAKGSSIFLTINTWEAFNPENLSKKGVLLERGTLA